MEDHEDRLKAFCSITIDDCFVVRDLKIIEGTNGLFVAMPSRKMTNNCHKCRHKNQIRATYCNHCGSKQRFEHHSHRETGARLYADIAHPINSECREQVQQVVLEEYEKEQQRFNQPGYRSRYDDEFIEEEASDLEAPSTSIDPASPGIPKPHLPSAPAEENSTTTQKAASSIDAPPPENHGFGAGIF